MTRDAHPLSGSPLNGSSASLDLDALYDARFSHKERQRKDAVWEVLCTKFFQRYVRDTDSVMDVGAGLGEFLRHIQCRKRIAVDVSPMRGRTLPRGTVEVIASGHRIGEHVPADSVDVVFCSNFFEHLPDKDTFLTTLGAIRSVLKPNGRLLVLQPNIRVLGGQYWDFVDHHLPLTDRTLVEASVMLGFQVEEIVPRFLPYTTRSRLPQAPWLVGLYLRCRPAWWLLGGQAWLVARKSAVHSRV
jgi:SAM-dependent methyltransferase